MMGLRENFRFSEVTFPESRENIKLNNSADIPTLAELKNRLLDVFTEDVLEKAEDTEENSDAESEKEKLSVTLEDGTVVEITENRFIRELTPEEKQILKDKLGWSDKKIDENCLIDENGVIIYKTDCQYLEGKKTECGVLYERKIIEYNGVKIEGVFPTFDSVFDVELPEEFYQSSSSKQFSESNKKLKEEVQNNSELRKMFTQEQLEDIENGNTPRGYTWHHNEDPGKMQLVKTEDHDKRIGGAAHTGGNSIWGNKSIEKSGNTERKGESF